MIKIIGCFGFFMLRYSQIVLAHLFLDPLPNVVEFNELLCTCGLVDSRRV